MMKELRSVDRTLVLVMFTRKLDELDDLLIKVHFCARDVGGAQLVIVESIADVVEKYGFASDSVFTS